MYTIVNGYNNKILLQVPCTFACMVKSIYLFSFAATPRKSIIACKAFDQFYEQTHGAPMGSPL